MAEPESKHPLIDVAGLIGDRRRIDWPQLDQTPVPEEDRDLLEQLKRLDQIAAVFDEGSSSPAPEANAASGGSSDRDPSSWAHLTIIQRIGEGQSAWVYRARDEKLQAEVALKLFKASEHGLHEARHLARVRHRNVVVVHGADERDGRAGLWMELIHGRTLSDLLRTAGALSAEEAIRIGIDLCGALAAIHAQGLVHGDVKAHNVMREAGGRIVLMDLGTGKDVRDTAPLGFGHDFAGTPLYLPPEIFSGSVRAQATDLYSLGVLLFHLVTRSYPVQGQTIQEVERAHAQTIRTHLRDLRPDLPSAFVSVVERAIAPNAGERFATAGRFEQALANCGRGSHWTPGRVAGALVVAAVVSGAISRWILGALSIAPQHSAAAVVVPSAPLPSLPYRIQTTIFRDFHDRPVRLRMGERLEPGAEIFAEVRTSVPVYLYVINEDEQGNRFRLFPMAGQSTTNPVPANQTVRLPGVQAGKPLNWLVDMPGDREHFIIFASPTQLTDYEKIFDAMPRPELDKPVMRLPVEAVGALRSVGGLIPAARAAGRGDGPLLSREFTTPLGDAEENATGVWIRQITLENPSR